MSIRALLFDKDGTLFDFHGTWMPLIHAAAALASGGDEGRAWRMLIETGWDSENDRVLAGSPIAAACTEDLAALWLEHAEGWELAALTDAMDTLFTDGSAQAAVPVTDLGQFFHDMRRRDYRLGIATNDSEAGARAMLAPFGVLDKLDYLAGYDSGHGSKPGPGMALGFCRAVGIAPEAVAVVGDNGHDLAMGRRAGCGLVVGVLTGTSAHDDLAADADNVLDDITQLPALLERNNRTELKA
jgi:phosphoglycolate phosphatase